MGRSLIPPSSAGIWGKQGGCTAYGVMRNQCPKKETSEAAKEGIASHAIAQRMLEAATKTQMFSIDKEQVIGAVAENGVIYTEEMWDCAELYSTDVIEVMESTNVFGGPTLGVEARVEATCIHANSRGYIDSFVYDRKNNTIYVWDYKYGRTYVEEFENLQAVNYIAGLMENFRLSAAAKVIFRIVQPRSFSSKGAIREWTTTGKKVELLIKQLAFHAKEAHENPKCMTGDHCLWCDAKHMCPAGHKAAMSAMDYIEAGVPEIMSNDALGVAYEMLSNAERIVMHQKTAMEAQIMLKLRSGESVPNIRASHGRGSTKWSQSDAEIASFGQLMGVDLTKPITVITPKQAKLKGINERVLTSITETIPGALKIEIDSTQRARKLFNQN